MNRKIGEESMKRTKAMKKSSILLIAVLYTEYFVIDLFNI